MIPHIPVFVTKMFKNHHKSFYYANYLQSKIRTMIPEDEIAFVFCFFMFVFSALYELLNQRGTLWNKRERDITKEDKPEQGGINHQLLKLHFQKIIGKNRSELYFMSNCVPELSKLRVILVSERGKTKDTLQNKK